MSGHASSCSYTNLSNYNVKSPGTLGTPAVPPSVVSGYYVVPQYGSIGYDALTHGTGPSCTGYFNITDGYGPNAGNCNTQYMQSPCGGAAL